MDPDEVNRALMMQDRPISLPRGKMAEETATQIAQMFLSGHVLAEHPDVKVASARSPSEAGAAEKTKRS